MYPINAKTIKYISEDEDTSSKSSFINYENIFDYTF